MELDVIVGWIFVGGSIKLCEYSSYVIQLLGVRQKDSALQRTVYVESCYIGVDINIFV